MHDAKQACIASSSKVMQDASFIQKYFLGMPVKSIQQMLLLMLSLHRLSRCTLSSSHAV